MSRGSAPFFQPIQVPGIGAESLGNPDDACVSVVIPAHNYAQFLPGAIASVLAQTHRSFEILVIDDGSTDSTRAVVAHETDPRVRYLWQENAGLSAARNAGIRAARMPFIAFLDADDSWLPDFLAEVMRKFAELDENFALIAANTARIDTAGHPLASRRSSPQNDRELTTRDFVLRNRPLSSSIVARREVFERHGGFDSSLRSSEDRDMWIRIATHRRVWFIGRPLALIRRHPGNMSKNATRMKRNSRTVLRKAFSARAVPRSDISFWLRAWSVHFFQIAWTHFDEGRRTRALAYMLGSLVLCPFFLQPQRINEPPLFRLRALAKFLVSRGSKSAIPLGSR